MAKFKSEDTHSDARERNQAEDPLKVGKIEYFEKFSGMGRILQSDVTTIPFHSRRTTYPVREGDVVNYRLEMGPSGLQAVDIAKRPGQAF
ncbi:hypothetical protein [Puia dinghuensis]|uniref:Cold-shock protein n=1 Tax=Puia dinghuensis TaxID=1792502 RepID=A0A8J2XQX5_9BACT|nr:hypothetical protein [Puia dinghuensis]GGA86560.1 hypothetical protein GCM10011511_07030 [Puia dinghuensis]